MEKTNDITLFQVSSLEKVYLDYTLPKEELKKASALKNERFSYQIAYRGNKNYMRRDMKIKVDSPLAQFINITMVGNVPTEYPIRVESDEHYEKYQPGLFPDVLYPIEDDTIEITCSVWHSLWISVELDGSVEKGIYPIDIMLSDGEVECSTHFELEVIDALLPEQEMIFTQWFHADCIADYYKIDVWSEKHWELIDKFMALATKNGINMMLTPIFTPPLDTNIGGERTTVQLLDIEKDGNNYTFGFEKLKRWIDICRKNGVKYFEMAHLFTQWGAEATPKIIAKENGEEKRIFGWDVSSTSKEYELFLRSMLPALSEFLKKEGVAEHTFFHISDEPHGEEHQEKYKKFKELVKELIPEYTITDALSEYAFYEKGITDLAIPSSNHIEPFIENNVPNLWAYYCCSQAVDVSNRFMAMPSYRNRIIGTHFYKFDIKGFLHWGYNFYNSALSKKKINPFLTTDAINTYPAGDCYSVYPGEDGPIESLRIVVFTEALQDLRALKMLEKYIGKEETVKLMESMAGMEIRFAKYPHTPDYILKLRETVNRMIKENL